MMFLLNDINCLKLCLWFDFFKSWGFVDNILGLLLLLEELSKFFLFLVVMIVLLKGLFNCGQVRLKNLAVEFKILGEALD